MTAPPVGLIETVRVIGGRAPLWDLHVARLTRSGRALGLALPELARPSGGDDRVVRFELTSNGLRQSERDVGSDEPVALSTSPAVHCGYPHKLAARAWLDAAGITARANGSDDGLLLDEVGHVVEATIWAVGWWIGERLVFPPLALGGLPSVARERIAENARGGIGTAEMRRDHVERLSLVACNAARGVVPVAVLDGQSLPMNHRTGALAKRFWERDHA